MRWTWAHTLPETGLHDAHFRNRSQQHCDSALQSMSPQVVAENWLQDHPSDHSSHGLWHNSIDEHSCELRQQHRTKKRWHTWAGILGRWEPYLAKQIVALERCDALPRTRQIRLARAQWPRTVPQHSHLAVHEAAISEEGSRSPTSLRAWFTSRQSATDRDHSMERLQVLTCTISRQIWS
jgi:hypothetical protein